MWESRVRENAYLVNLLAHRLREQAADSIALEDLIAEGVKALIDAAEEYSPGDGYFRTYAVQRIRGAMLDRIMRCYQVTPTQSRLSLVDD